MRRRLAVFIEHARTMTPHQNPFQVLLLALTFAASVPAISGDSGSVTVNRSVPAASIVLWGVVLTVGAAIGLAGSLTPRSPEHPGNRIIGLIFERSGLLLVGSATYIYVGVIATNTDNLRGVTYLIAVQLAYGTACFWRTRQITKALRDARKLRGLRGR